MSRGPEAGESSDVSILSFEDDVIEAAVEHRQQFLGLGLGLGALRRRHGAVNGGRGRIVEFEHHVDWRRRRISRDMAQNADSRRARNVAPDIAQVRSGVTTRGKTVQEAAEAIPR